MQRPLLFAVLAACVSPAVSNDSADIREMTQDEALADFDVMVSTFRSLYGAMERKEQKYGFDFEAMSAQFRARIQHADVEADYRGIFFEYLAQFKDAHLSLANQLTSDDSHGYSLPFMAMPVEDTYVVYSVDAGVTDIKRGDELLSVDGESAADIVKRTMKYTSMPLEASAKHDAALNLSRRPSYLSHGLGPTATLKLRGEDGQIRTVTKPWKESPHLLPVLPAVVHGEIQGRSIATDRVVKAELSKFGAREPFFWTAEVKAALHATEVKPSAQALQKYGLPADAAANVNYFAVTYAVGARKVLLVRLPDYQPEDLAAGYLYLKALLFDQRDKVDALVLDQTHNPGGALPFAELVLGLLSKQPKFSRPVQRQHADRRWIEQYASAAADLRAADPGNLFADEIETMAHEIDKAYSAKETLSPALAFPYGSSRGQTNTDADAWTKPLLVLADELSVSCADTVPLVVKANNMGKVFGATTMGGGGSVQEVATLPNSNAVLSLSRGLITVFDPTGQYPESRFVEDNGVDPDVPYEHTLADFRAGYVQYVQAFNAAIFQ